MHPHDLKLTSAMPEALGPEKAVLSILMQAPGLAAEHPLDPEIFNIPAHRILYQHIREADEVEFITFVEQLRAAGELDAVGGPAGVAEVYSYAPYIKSFPHYLEILRDRWARRKAIAASRAAIEAAHDLSDPAAYLAALAGPVSEVFETATAATSPPDTSSLVQQFLATFKDRIDGKQSSMGLPTGITEIDRALNGFHPGHVWIIGAYTSGGKSTLATQIMGNLGSQGIPSLYLPLEGSVEAAVERSMIQLSQLPHQAVTDPRQWAISRNRSGLSKAELSAIDQAAKTLLRGMHFQRPANRRATTAMAAIRRAKRIHGIKVAFIDYLQLLQGNRRHGDNGEKEHADISHDLQELAVELGITIILLSQQNAEGTTKYAQAAEEDCDRFLSIVQDRDRKSETFQQHQHILVAKDRHTSQGGTRLPLVLNRQNVRFEPGSPPAKQPAAAKSRFG
jgi:replicative DNA helicase